jgi:ferric-dicitrate binding protein FerR (iron transport regulator)
MYRQALEALDTALAALPARTRLIFEACRIHGQRQADVAARLNVALNTVERDLTHANDQIEAALRRWRGEKVTRDGTARGRRKSLAALLGLGAVGVLGTNVWHHWQAQAKPWIASLATPRGQRLEQVLPDGSTLALDADSRADLRFTQHERAVALLQGAAFFSVASDAGRPFTVNAGQVTVTVLGTRFGMEITPAGNVLVQVESGRVRVARSGQVLADGLTAGQGLDIPPGDDAPHDNQGPVAPWRHGRLHFDATPLGDALQRLSRYARMDLRADTRASALHVSGTVEIAHARDWLDALPAALPVRVVPQPDGGLLVARR